MGRNRSRRRRVSSGMERKATIGSTKLWAAIGGIVTLGIVAGAVGGSAVNTTPKRAGETLSDILPASQRVTRYEQNATASRGRPDQFPLETPSGRIEVYELAENGRFRGRRDPYFSRYSSSAYEEADYQSSGYEDYGRYADDKPAPVTAVDARDNRPRNSASLAPVNSAQKSRTPAQNQSGARLISVSDGSQSARPQSTRQGPVSPDIPASPAITVRTIPDQVQALPTTTVRIPSAADGPSAQAD